MSHFSPLTLGYDWEVFALKDSMLPADGNKFERIADRVNTELEPMEAHREWLFIEMGPGVTSDWTELVSRTNRYVEWVREEFTREEMTFFPCGTVPSEGGTAGLHIHVGTIANAEAEVRIHNAFTRHLPAFMALMVNSPVHFWHSRKWKSYRMGGFAWGSGGVNTIAHPHLSNSTWGGDIAWRRNDKPTVEFRLADSCCSPALLTEYALLVAGFADWIANHLDDQPVVYSPSEYQEFLENRYRATKDGLQTTLMSGTKELPVVDAISDIIEKASAGMRRLSASEEDLVIIPKMLAKRQTQADFQLAYLDRCSDLAEFIRAFANVLKDVTAFDQYLDLAPVLPQTPVRDLDEALLERIGSNTHVNKLTREPFYPPVLLEERLRRMEAEGKIRITSSPEDGVRCSRVSAPAEIKDVIRS